MRDSFSRFGIPRTVVTDNGPAFASEEFSKFMQDNGVWHIKTAPYHPESNGLAERAVGIIKQRLRKESGTLQERLASVLLAYRITPQGTTGVTPSELLLGHKIRTRLDLVHPSLHDKVGKSQAKQKEHHDVRCEERQGFQPGSEVFVRYYPHQNPPWVPGHVLEQSGPQTYLCATGGAEKQRHIDDLRTHGVSEQKREQCERQTCDTSSMESGTGMPIAQERLPIPTEPPATVGGGGETVRTEEEEAKEDKDKAPTVEEPAGVRRSGRSRKAPVRLNL